MKVPVWAHSEVKMESDLLTLAFLCAGASPHSASVPTASGFNSRSSGEDGQMSLSG